MILKSLRLKNIKSYGNGPAGGGINVQFHPGINCVAGRNGHGKSTLIEALGYALFLAEPLHEERFGVNAYFLRSGEGTGEIDVVFEHGGNAYRVERDVGQHNRKSKVVQLDDGSTCAQDEKEVSEFLCRLFGFKEYQALSDLFCNLIGVKQGRLTWPFDSKPAVAKQFFEPLLDVAIFSESTGRLSEAQVEIKTSLQDAHNRVAAPIARLDLLRDSSDKVAAKEAEAEVRSRALERTRKQKEEADAIKSSLELKQAVYQRARNNLDEASHHLLGLRHKRETEQQHLDESHQAREILQRSHAGYQAYVQAEDQLRLLQNQQAERAKLERQRAEATGRITKWETSRSEAARHANDCVRQSGTKSKAAQALHSQIAETTRHLEKTKTKFDQTQKEAEAVRRALDALEGWMVDLDAKVQINHKSLEELMQDWARLESWDQQAVARAAENEQQCDHAAREFGHAVVKAEEAQRTLAEQLRQITGGMCPFLKEKCRQFDDKAVASDLERHEQQRKALAEEHRKATKAHQHARKAWEKLTQQASEMARLSTFIEQKVSRFEEQHGQLFPPTIQKHLAHVKKWVQSPLEVDPLPLLTVSELWNENTARLDVVRLREITDSESAFSTHVSGPFKRALNQVHEKLDEFARNKAERARSEQNVEHDTKQLARIEQELKEVTAKINQLLAETQEAEGQAKQAAAQVAALEEKLQPFANLDQQLRSLTDLKDTHGTDYKTYLGARTLAEKIGSRQQSLQNAITLEKQAEELVRQKKEAHELAASEFDPTALENARQLAADATANFTMADRALATCKKELGDEKARLRQWEIARLEQEKIQDEIDRLSAAAEVAKLAAKVLKGAAPAVAQHLCNRIGAHAQSIFNQINHEPIELEWRAEPQYSLRIVPGERRFAMLSGGEQTKLAVAMILAMIQQFSSLRFAIFDEPTYGIDAESRPKLADAILEAQKAAGLEQLIIVSHDNAFEGKIENVIEIRKSAVSGSEIVATD